MGRAEVQTRRRFVVVEDDQEGRESLGVHLDTDGDAVIAQGADAIYVGKDQIKALAVFLLSEIGETAEAVKASAPSAPSEDPFPWGHQDVEGDEIQAVESIYPPRICVKVFNTDPVANGADLSPEAALDLGERLIAWGRANG